jgi:undecaprenyl-diphosphatase
MLEHIIELDRSLFLVLNGFHSPFVDEIMVVLSARTPWIPLYLAILFAMFFSFKWDVTDKLPKPKFRIITKPVRYGLIAFFGVLITFALTDSIAYQIKLLVERPRPGYDPIIENMVRLLEYKGGIYGFLSNHAANVFGLAVFTSSYFKKKFYTVFIFLWAALVSYSRVYVGKHFPLDVVCGAILGIIIGFVIFSFAKQLFKRIKLKPYISDVVHN